MFRLLSVHGILLEVGDFDLGGVDGAMSLDLLVGLVHGRGNVFLIHCVSSGWRRGCSGVGESDQVSKGSRRERVVDEDEG